MNKRFQRIVMVALCFCLLFSGNGYAANRQPEADNQINEILQSLSLEQKIGQMLMPAFRKWDGEKVVQINDEIQASIQEFGFGGVILFAENTAGTESTMTLIEDMQKAAMESESGIPLLLAVDQEGGYIYRLGTGTATGGNMALGASSDPQMAARAAGLIGSELAALGFSVDFAPTLDVNNNPSNPVIGVRSFSDDPTLVAAFGSAFIQGLQSKNVSAALKHFPGHGDTATDSHSGLPCIDKSLDQLYENELIPFKAGIAAGADMVMTAHIQYPQIEKTDYRSIASGEKITLPATLSKTIITDILRGQLGFDGVVTTDAMNMDAIAKHFDSMDAARLAINAGVDILLMPVVMDSAESLDVCRDYIKGIALMVEQGRISESTIDAAVTRILNLKMERGLLEKASEISLEKALKTVGSKANHEEEWDIVKKGITLVKNTDRTLPLKVNKGGKAVLLCSYSNEVNSMTYAVECLKTEGMLAKDAECNIYCYQNTEALSEEQKEAVLQADAILASVESYSAANVKGGWQASFIDDAIEFCHENGKKIAVISLHLPYDLARYQEADALLSAYNAKGMNTLPTEYNGETAAYGPNLPAAVYAAFGGFAPSGKLPVQIPKLNENAEYTEKVLYPRGYGLDGWSGSWNFKDILPGSYYAKAVDWALGGGITNGVSKTMFAPKDICTKGQMMTFLWRMAGMPVAEGEEQPYESCYTSAVQWALAEGIAQKNADGSFDLNAACSRSEAVQYLAAWDGVKTFSEDLPFTDVAEDAPYREVLSWAYQEGIVKGVSDTTFIPDGNCTRSEALAMLYRYAVE